MADLRKQMNRNKFRGIAATPGVEIIESKTGLVAGLVAECHSCEVWKHLRNLMKKNNVIFDYQGGRINRQRNGIVWRLFCD